jgi:hypothetical protein
MKELFKDVLEDKTIAFAFFLNIFFVIAAVAYILFFYRKLPPVIPIFNQLPWGEQRLGGTLTIFIPVLTAVLILAINIITSALIYKKIPLISRMFAAVSLLIGILTFLFIIRTITLTI